MREYTFTLGGVTITVKAMTFFEACGKAGTAFYNMGLDTHTAS